MRRTANMLLAHLRRVDSSTVSLWTGPFSIGCLDNFYLLLPCVIEIPVFNANSIHPDQTPPSADSDLGLPGWPVGH